MKTAIYMDGEKFTETDFVSEDDFERVIKENSKTLFGAKTIYFDLKRKIESRALGGSIPDGFLFDFKNEETPEFYLVEVELARHDFYKHVFPQITKFFAFFKNMTSRNGLIEKLDQLIKSEPKLEEEFKKYLGKREIYKTLKDAMEKNQNILLILDENKPELQDLFETYTDTWYKMVSVEILKEYTANGKKIFTINPDFEDIEFAEPMTQELATKSGESWQQRLQSINVEFKTTIEELEKRIFELGNVRAMERTRKAYYRGKKRARACFAILELSKDGVIARIRAEKTNFDDPKNWSIGGIRKGMFFDPQSKFIITSKGQVDYAMTLIKQAFDVTENLE
jgi:hypothetical protein